jgi:transposase
MFTKNDSTQQKLEMVYIENLVPQDHLLRKIDKHINFSFIYELVKDLYCADNGRPALDPVVLFKMIFIGYLFGIRSERQLEREIQVNVAYRWFLGLSLTDKVPDYSTISQNRRRRFKNTDVAQKIFDEIVRQAIKYGLVDGKILYSDSTHLKANANKKKSAEIQIQKSTKDYLDELDKAIDEERKKHGKKPLKKRENKPELKKIKISTTDPESGYMMRDGKPEGFFYLDHRTVDSKHNIIVDTHTTPGNVNDVDPYLERLDATIDKFNFNTKCVGLDAGYYVNHICKGIIDRKLKGALGYRLGPHEKGKFTKNKFQYVIEQDVYYCSIMHSSIEPPQEMDTVNM